MYDYAPGKVDWMARGLPLEGERAAERRAIAFATDEVVTCGLDDSVGLVRDRMMGSRLGFALVLGPDGVLLGRLRRSSLDGDPGMRVEQAMEPGPSTNRPNISAAKLLVKLREGGLRTAILTDPNGRFMGVVRRADLERA